MTIKQNKTKKYDSETDGLKFVYGASKSKKGKYGNRTHRSEF